MDEPQIDWPTAIVEAIKTLPPDALKLVSYAKGTHVAVYVTVVSEDAEDSRTLIIRLCPDDPEAVEIVEENSGSRQLVSCVNANEFGQAIQRTIVEWIPTNLDDQFVQLMDDLLNSESAEELQRQLRSLVDPAARQIVEESIALREAVEVSSPTREEKRRLLNRTNELLILFAQYFTDKDCSATFGGCRNAR